MTRRTSRERIHTSPVTPEQHDDPDGRHKRRLLGSMAHAVTSVHRLEQVVLLRTRLMLLHADSALRAPAYFLVSGYIG